MRYVWFGLLVLVVSAPLVLVSILFAEAKLPALDALTLREPMGVRKTIAEVAMNEAGYGKEAKPKLERVLRLDPENPDVWARRCSDLSYRDAKNGTKEDPLSVCQHAVGLKSTKYGWMNVGRAQEAKGDYCEAYEAYSSARGLMTGNDSYVFQSLGRTALLCGRVDVGIVELKQAADTDAADLTTNQDEDEADDSKASLVTDREWLTFAYANTKQPELASQSCGLAHPDWQNCSCEVVKGEIKCDGIKSEAKTKK
jgi:tetratricopeptide (TPR) repeat protein